MKMGRSVEEARVNVFHPEDGEMQHADILFLFYGRT